MRAGLLGKLENRAKKLGLNTCGECRFWKGSICERTQLRFPSMKSDIVCGNFVHKKK